MGIFLKIRKGRKPDQMTYGKATMVSSPTIGAQEGLKLHLDLCDNGREEIVTITAKIISFEGI